MTNGANYKRGKLHHSPWHSDIRTSNQLNNQQMPWESFSLYSILSSAILVGLKIIHISLEHYTAGIVWNIYITFRHISLSGTLRFVTSAPRRLGKPRNIPWDEYQWWVVGYTRSDSCRSDDCASHLGIRQDSFDQFLGRSACLATVKHDW